MDQKMQVTGSKLLRDPVLQSTVKDQKLPWMTTGEAKKVNKKVEKRTSNISKKLLNMSVKKKEDKRVERYGEPHKIITECLKYVTDEFWYEIIENMSYGECPKDFALRDNNISFKRSLTKIVNLSLSATNDYKRLCHDLIGFISSCANIHSPEDIRNTQLLELHIDQVNQESDKIATWKSIKSTNLQSINLYNYARTLSDEHGLDVDETYSLLVFYVRMSGLVPPESIVLENGVIREIKGLSHDPDTNTLYFEPSMNDVKRRRLFVKVDDTDDTSEYTPSHLSPTRTILDSSTSSADTSMVEGSSLVNDDYGDSNYNFNFDKQWRQSVKDYNRKPSSSTSKNPRSQVLQSLSLITPEDLEDLSHSITDM